MAEKTMIVATIVIAAFAVAQFLLQYWQHLHDVKVAKADHRVRLFERRLSFYLEVEKLMSEVVKKGGPPIDAVMKLRYETRNADFLFPEIQVNFINDLVLKGFAHRKATQRWEPLRARAYAGEELSAEENEEKTAALDERQKIEDWFFKVMESGRFKAEFEPVLNIHSDL